MYFVFCFIFSRFLGFKKTILPNRKLLIRLVDKYKNGELQWDKLSRFVKEAHRNRIGSPKRRVAIQGRPKEEDYFYSNPNECLQLLDEPLRLMVN